MMDWWPVGANIYWLPTIVFLAHIAEEVWTFPRWASRHFAPTSHAFYVYSHIVLIAIFLTTGQLAVQAFPATFWPWFCLALQWGLFSNFLFHATTTIAFRSYSPGVITASALFSLATAWFLDVVIEEELLTPAQIASSLLVGAAMGVSVVASLLVPTNIKWRVV